jgi:catechol 2,3-dioxygenase-like lactoylglutathione lyase family enzyme
MTPEVRHGNDLSAADFGGADRGAARRSERDRPLHRQGTRLLNQAAEFRIRTDRTDASGSPSSRWVHVGTDDTYLALTRSDHSPAEAWEPYSGLPGVNHLGYEVDDVDALRARMLAAGYEESTVPNAHPHRKRVYFMDPEGNDWEFVQYYSQNPAERNDYEIMA